MAQKTAIVNKLLTNVSKMTLIHGLICDKVLPFLAFKQRTALLGEYGTGHLRIVSSLIGGDGKYKRSESITRESSDFQIRKHGLFDTVSEDDLENVEEPFDAEVDKTIGLTSQILLQKEATFKDLLGAISQGETVGAADRFTEDASDPFPFFQKAQDIILDKTSHFPNVAIMSARVFNALKYNKALINSYRGGSTGAKTGGPIGMDEIKKALGVERIEIAQAPFAGSDGTISQLWPNEIYFLVSPMTPMKRQVAYGYKCGRTRSGGKVRIQKYRAQNPPEGTDIFASTDYVFAETNPFAAYRLQSVI